MGLSITHSRGRPPATGAVQWAVIVNGLHPEPRMEYVRWFIDFFLHLDKHLAEVIASYGVYTYALLFVIIFLETGLVVTPILPGDSLLFAAGTFAALGSLHVGVVFGLLAVAAVLGDTVNYAIGKYLGPKVFHFPKSRFFNPEHLKKTHAFYEKYGGKTIIIARFVPIVRTFAPFVAGIGAMTYPKFLAYNVVGGIAWVAICVFAGYFFGNLPFVRKNFSLVILAIIVISVMPAVIEYLRHRRDTKASAS
jgi:membrane-associated protein